MRIAHFCVGASLSNSTSIDDSFETIINVVFCILSIFLVLLIVGFQVRTLLLLNGAHHNQTVFLNSPLLVVPWKAMGAGE